MKNRLRFITMFTLLILSFVMVACGSISDNANESNVSNNDDIIINYTDVIPTFYELVMEANPNY